MRINCPHCGERDLREWSYTGDAVALARPAPDANGATWDNYLHLRKNPAGKTRDLWHHTGGCGAWIIVTRDTVTHEIYKTELASKAKKVRP